MIGDGLNDAGALQQSNVGITVAGDINNFTPSCDAILDAGQLQHLPQVLRLARAARQVIHLSFAVSIVYNIIGLWFAMRGALTPVAAAILMPCSTLSIVIITTGVSSLLAWRYGLSLTSRQ
jgi:Cu+-exporting ATPase